MSDIYKRSNKGVSFIKSLFISFIFWCFPLDEQVFQDGNKWRFSLSFYAFGALAR